MNRREFLALMALLGCGCSDSQYNALVEPPVYNPTPTQNPTPAPTEEPTPEPTQEPTQEPTEQPIEERIYGRDQDHFRMAFVVLGSDAKDYSYADLRFVTAIKDIFPSSFNHATFGEATMDCSSPVEFVYDDGEYHNTGKLVKAIERFSQLGEEFDFITFYPVKTSLAMAETANFHVSVRNAVMNIGINGHINLLYRNSPESLFGFNCMNNCLSKRTGAFARPEHIWFQNVLLHETAHQWGVYIGNNYTGDYSAMLDLKVVNIHFSPYLCFDEDTAMFARNWVEISPGLFYDQSDFSDAQVLHPFMMYLMGLFTKDNYDFSKKFDLLKFGYVEQDRFRGFFGLPYRKISIEDIIAYEGERYRLVNLPPVPVNIPILGLVE